MPSVHCESLEKIIWQPNDAPLLKTDDQIDIWRIQISSSLQWLERCRALLNDSEISRSLNYKQEKDRTRFIISRGILRILLNGYSGLSPLAIQFGLSADKKPYFINPNPSPIQFNTAHSGDWILFAFSNGTVGIDVEKTDPDFNYDEILKTAFSIPEMDFINRSAAMRRSFYLLWTRKEALVKGLGRGIDDELPRIPCLDGCHEILNDLTDAGKSWNVSSFETDGNYIASLAYPSLLPPNAKLYFREIYSLIKD